MNKSAKRLLIVAAVSLALAVVIAALRIVFPEKVNIDTVGNEFYLDAPEEIALTDIRISGKVVTYPFVGDVFTGDITIGKACHENQSFNIGKRFRHLHRYEGVRLITTGFVAYNDGFENMIIAMYDFDENGKQKTWTSESGKVVTIGTIGEEILQKAFLPY